MTEALDGRTSAPEHVRRTCVCIVGAGPSGLVLSQILAGSGVDSIVLERRSQQYVEARVRAGLLEQGTVDVLCAAGVGERLKREGLVHRGLEFRLDGETHRLAFADFTGTPVWMYGQQEIVKDLIKARLAADGRVHFGIDDVRVERIGQDGCTVRCTIDKRPTSIECDFLAGCDGFHGVCRNSVPASKITGHEYDYPVAWLGILAAAPPLSPELIYAVSRRGFALQSMRSHTVSRLYLQVPPSRNIADNWSDQQVWDELDMRLTNGSGKLPTGPVLERTFVTMRSFVADPMQYKSLFLVGDAAHVVPPSAAKGLNLAVADAQLLANALIAWYRRGMREGLDTYSETALRRAWMGQEFSAWMTNLLHPLPNETVFEQQLRSARFIDILNSRISAAHFSAQYVGISR